MADKVDPRTGELVTTNYGWTKPTVGASVDAWGGYINSDLDGIDSTVHGIQTSIPAASTTTPAMAGTGAVGTGTTWARADHVHPTDARIIGESRIINGDMGRDQRNNGAFQSITAGAALAYTVDRWWAASTGANSGGQQLANTGASGSPSQYIYRISGAAGITGIQFGQRIEAAYSFDLAGNTATLSVNLANGLLTTVTWTAYYANTTDAFGTLAAPTKTQIATGTFTVIATLTRYSVSFSIPAVATTGIEIVFSVGAQTSATWGIGNVKLEIGTVATPFNRQSLAKSLADCQRYFEMSYDIGTVPGAITANGATLWRCITADPFTTGTSFFKVAKRASPTVTIYSPNTGASGKIYAVNPSTDQPAYLPNGAGTTAFAAGINNSSVSSTSVTHHWTASAEL